MVAISLGDFLISRVAEDEHRAQTENAAGRAPSRPGDLARQWAAVRAQALADCRVKRRIVNHRDRVLRTQAQDGSALAYDRGLVAGFEFSLRYLASPYAKHPDFSQRWSV